MSEVPSKRAARLRLEDADRVDRLCDCFEAAWRAGGRPRIEDFLDESRDAVRAVLLQELISAEVERRLRLGERPEAGEYLDRFPGDGELVVRALNWLRLPDGIAPDPCSELNRLVRFWEGQTNEEFQPLTSCSLHASERIAS
jgi:hypothetical protein